MKKAPIGSLRVGQFFRWPAPHQALLHQVKKRELGRNGRKHTMVGVVLLQTQKDKLQKQKQEEQDRLFPQLETDPEEGWWKTPSPSLRLMGYHIEHVYYSADDEAELVHVVEDDEVDPRILAFTRNTLQLRAEQKVLLYEAVDDTTHHLFMCKIQAAANPKKEKENESKNPQGS